MVSITRFQIIIDVKLIIVAPVAAASGRAKKCYKTRWTGKNFHFYSGIYFKINAAAIVAPVAAASGRAKKCYKTRWTGKKFHFHSGIYLKIYAAAIVAPVAAASGRAKK